MGNKNNGAQVPAPPALPAMTGIKNVTPNSDGKGIDKIRMILTCPLSSIFGNKPGCGCVAALPWYHVSCNEPDWIDKGGNIYCGSKCSMRGKYCIFDCEFICGTNKEKRGRLKAQMVMKVISSMRNCAGEVNENEAIDYKQFEHLMAWCQSLENTLMEKAKPYMT